MSVSAVMADISFNAKIHDEAGEKNLNILENPSVQRKGDG